MSLSKQPLLSVIIPFYNNEKFIIDALQSLFSQIDDDVEVVIIDDGSTDNSKSLVDQFLETLKSSNFHFISHQNQGIAATRNVGLHHAKGTYVTFLDGDDILSPDYYSTLSPYLHQGEFDIIDFNFLQFTDKVPLVDPSETPRCIPYASLKHEIYYLKPVFERSNWHLWSRIFRRELLNGESFENGCRYEDVIFTPFQYFKTKKIAHIDKVLYYYRVNDSGITRNIQVKDIDDILFAMSKMLAYIQTCPNSDKVAEIVVPMIENCFIEAKKMTKKLYGYYYYTPENIAIFKLAAELCKNTSLSKKKYFQMKYPFMDTCISKLNYHLKIRR
jgi:glycosyltransferase involved in cell wall biosynthesis